MLNKKNIFLIIIISFLVGCSSSKIISPLTERILKSQTAINIPVQKFSDYIKWNDYYYSGCGNLSIMRIQIRGLKYPYIETKFDKIIYDPVDSTLYLKGKIFLLESSFNAHRFYYPNSSIRMPRFQIIFGKVTEIPAFEKSNEEEYIGEETIDAKIDIESVYIPNKKDEFEITVKIKSSISLIFACREISNIEGLLWFPSFDISMYNVFQLLNDYKSIK